MTSQELRFALRSGQSVFGTLIASDSPDWLDHVARIGLDFVFIDTEHIALDRKALAWMCHGYAALGLPPIVRILSPDVHLARMALDAGAAGIMAPYVETVEQVKALVGAVKLWPLKGERLEAALSDRSTLEPPLAEFLDRHAGRRILTINVESRPALERIDALASVEGLDGILVGPHDLSINLGVPEDYESAVFDQAVRTILRSARQHGIAAGTFSMLGMERVRQWAEDGLNFIVHGADCAAMRDAIGADIRAMREMMGQHTGAGRVNRRGACVAERP